MAIIGGGFTGASLASCLLRRASQPLSVAVIDQGPDRARGVAYCTQHTAHLLNVPAENMSARDDDPEHFLRWARQNFDSGAQPGDFLPRRLYGQYLDSILEEATRLRRAQFLWVRDEAVRVVPGGQTTQITLRNGEHILAHKVVLAMGNFPPGDLRLPGHKSGERFVSNPWAADALDGVQQDKSVLLVGSGLTSVDMVLALRERGFRGTIHLLSRHGLLPQKHRKEDSRSPWPLFWGIHSPRTARGLARLVREQINTAEAQGGDWRDVIDSLRSCTSAIWQSLPLAEQRRFLRHLRPYWDSHRHRVAPQIATILDYQIINGKIQSHAGRITEYCESESGIDVTYRDRKTGAVKRLRVDHVINCTGPESDCRKLASPLLADLMSRGVIRPDSLALGLDTAESGALIDRTSQPSDFLYTAGPARKGSLWESIAVPELRVQVAQLASLLVADACPRREIAETDAAPVYLSAR